jgi:phosphatidylserine synthase 2
MESDSVSTAKLGPNAWLALAVLVVEILVVVKNGHGKFTNPWPRHVLLAWTVVFVGTASYLFAWQRRLNQAATSTGKGKGKGKKTSTRSVVKSSSSSARRSSSRKSKKT